MIFLEVFDNCPSKVILFGERGNGVTNKIFTLHVSKDNNFLKIFNQSPSQSDICLLSVLSLINLTNEKDKS